MKKLIAAALSICLMAGAQGAAKNLSAEKTIRLANMTKVSRDAVLVVDTGLGTESAQRGLQAAKKLAGRRKL